MFRARRPSSIFITSHKMPGLPRKMTTITSKLCACQENWNSSSENLAKVLRLLHKTTFDTLQSTSDCHEVPRLPRETKQRNVWNLQKWPLLQNLPARPYGDRANGCERLRTVRQRRANTSSTPRPPEWNGNPCYAFGKRLKIRFFFDSHRNLGGKGVANPCESHIESQRFSR